IAALALLLMAAGGASLAGSPLPFRPPRASFGVVRPVAVPPNSRIQQPLPPGFGPEPDGDGPSELDARANATVRRLAPVPQVVPDGWVLRLRRGVDPDAAARRFGCVVKRALSLPNTYVVGRDPEAAAAPMASVAALGAAV